MSKANFTAQDVKGIIENIFKSNDEQITLTDADSGEHKNASLVDYLKIQFYAWKNRLVDKGDYQYTGTPILSSFEDWAQSLNFSMNESYALVELIDIESTASTDIDSAVLSGRITFEVQTDKISNLDYYITKLRNAYLGNAQEIQDQNGNLLKAYINLGMLTYDTEPTTMQLGEIVEVSIGFNIAYLNDALTYADQKISISFDGDDEYNEYGGVVGDTHYLTMPLTKATWQNVFTSKAVVRNERPDLTGFVATALSTAITLSFYDFNKPLMDKFNEIMWQRGAYRVNGKIKETSEVNIPVYVKLEAKGQAYVFKCVIDNMSKTLTNNDFNTSTLSLKGWGKN